MEKKKAKAGTSQAGVSAKALMNPNTPMNLELKKTPVNLNQGFLLSVRPIPQSTDILVGMGDGRVLVLDGTYSHQDSAGIYDISAVNKNTWASVDNNSVIRVVTKGKVTLILPSTSCQFMTHSNQIGKVLSCDGPFLYWIGGKKDTVSRLHLRDCIHLGHINKSYPLRDNKVEDIPFDGNKQLFQISVCKGRIFGIREDGWLVMAQQSSNDPSKNKWAENHKHSGSKPKKKEEDEDSDDDPFPDQELPGGEWTCKKVQIQDMTLHENDILEAADPNNSSLVFGSDKEDGQAEKSHAEGSKSMVKSLYKDYGDKPIKNCFFRTVAASDHYCVCVAHDGKGHNTLYIYDTMLSLKMHKNLEVKKTDYGLNPNAYIHKLQLLSFGERLVVFGMTHHYEHKLVVWEYNGGRLRTLKKYKAVHSRDGFLCSASRDKSLNIYSLKFV